VNEGEAGTARHAFLENSQAIWGRGEYAIYALALAGSISLWFLAIRAPLWLDETFSFWQINRGFWQILSRRGQVSAAYPYILWLTTRITGTSEVALRIPSVLAMLAAAYLLYRAARELFDRDIALIVVIFFCAHPIVAFAAIDARPYAFGALASNGAIYMLVRLRHSNSSWLAAAFGIAGAASTHFQLLFGAVLLVLAVCFLVAKAGDMKTLARQAAVAFGSFALVFLPVIPDALQLFRYRQTYVFEKTTPSIVELSSTLAPGWSVFIFTGIVLIAVATKKVDWQNRPDRWRFLVCASLGLVPILILFGVSALTPTNIFVARYRLIAIPGIALYWGWLVSRIDSRLLRVLFCVALVTTGAYRKLRSENSHQHGYTWKYALELAEKNASPDNAPVLICSDFPSSDYFPIPVGAAAKDSSFFTPLSYYKLSVPVVGLPRALNDEAMRIGSDFVQQAGQRRERFLALGWAPSYATLQWLTNVTSKTYETRILGQPDGVVVREFTPRSQADRVGVAGP
jgi:mannosyltransferase